MKPADVYGFAALLLLAACAVGLTLIAMHAPVVLSFLLVLALLVWAGHLIGDEVEARVRDHRRTPRHAATDPEEIPDAD